MKFAQSAFKLFSRQPNKSDADPVPACLAADPIPALGNFIIAIEARESCYSFAENSKKRCYGVGDFGQVAVTHATEAEATAAASEAARTSGVVHYVFQRIAKAVPAPATIQTEAVCEVRS